MKRYLRALPVAVIGMLLVPATALAAEESKIGVKEDVTKVMFILIFVLILLLGIAVWFESRKEY